MNDIGVVINPLAAIDLLMGGHREYHVLPGCGWWQVTETMEIGSP